LHDRATADAWLSKVRRRSRVTPRTRIESATGKSTSATDTDFMGTTIQLYGCAHEERKGCLGRAIAVRRLIDRPTGSDTCFDLCTNTTIIAQDDTIPSQAHLILSSCPSSVQFTSFTTSAALSGGGESVGEEGVARVLFCFSSFHSYNFITYTYFTRIETSSTVMH